MLEEEAEIGEGGREPFITTRNGLSLSERIEELKTVPLFTATLPPPLPTVAKSDLRTMSERFDDIRKGKVAVT